MLRFSTSWTSLIVLACTAVLAFGFLAACARQRDLAAAQSSAASPDSKPIEVVLDPRVELLGLMRTLSREPEALQKLDFAYARKVREHFAPLTGHPALARFAAADRALHGGDLPVWTALHFAPTPAFEAIAPLPAVLTDISPDPTPFNDLLAAMREFSAASNFFSFFAAASAADDAAMLGPVRHSLARGRITAPFEAYYGQALPNYRVILAPLLHDANYGLHVIKPDGNKHACVVVVRRRSSGGKVQFGVFGELRPLLWHEFGHSLVNPVIDAHMDAVRPLASVLLPSDTKNIEAGGLAQIRLTGRMSEYLIRAIGVRLTTRESGEKHGQRELQQQIKRGYPLLPGLCAELERYEAERARYPTLPDFLPEVIRYFEAAAKP